MTRLHYAQFTSAKPNRTEVYRYRAECGASGFVRVPAGWNIPAVRSAIKKAYPHFGDVTTSWCPVVPKGAEVEDITQ